jgi:regulator of sigma E protease
MFVVLAILALGVFVVVHEAGHYLVARWSRMRVERFSIGFGPPILKWRSGETQFQVAPVPFGGFVQITGMNPHEDFDEKDPHVYPNRPAILRFLVILAGPAMNYVLAVVVVFAFYLSAGVEQEVGRSHVSKVEAGEPAAGVLEPEDVLLKVNGVDVFWSARQNRPDFSSELQKAGGAPVKVTVLRHGKNVDTTIAAKLAPADKDHDKPFYKVGVALVQVPDRKDVGVAAAAGFAIAYPVEKTQQIVGDLVRVVTGKIPGEITGPFGIVDVMQDQFSQGWGRSLQLIAMLNVMLGLFNLLPIPGLDGGRLAFLTYELATRRRANPKVEATVHMFGILILFAVLIVVSFKDIRNLIHRLFA